MSNIPANDGKFIELAIKRNVSGAVYASTKTGIPFLKKFPRGARRGHGLRLIVDKCKDLGVQFSLLSWNGYFILTEDGDDIGNARPGKIFPGTFYHFLIPALKEARS